VLNSSESKLPTGTIGVEYVLNKAAIIYGLTNEIPLSCTLPAGNSDWAIPKAGDKFTLGREYNSRRIKFAEVSQYMTGAYYGIIPSDDFDGLPDRHGRKLLTRPDTYFVADIPIIYAPSTRYEGKLHAYVVVDLAKTFKSELKDNCCLVPLVTIKLITSTATAVMVKKDCSCDMTTLMRSGCVCGAINKYEDPLLIT
jgi:hypothetical protein